MRPQGWTHTPILKSFCSLNWFAKQRCLSSFCLLSKLTRLSLPAKWLFFRLMSQILFYSGCLNHRKNEDTLFLWFMFTVDHRWSFQSYTLEDHEKTAHFAFRHTHTSGLFSLWGQSITVMNFIIYKFFYPLPQALNLEIVENVFHF